VADDSTGLTIEHLFCYGRPDMTRHDLERRQKIVEYIARTVAERGYPPSVREIAEAVGLASTSAVHHHLIALERDGLLERGTHSSRALRLTARAEIKRPRPASRITPFRMPMDRDVISLPVLGEIAAGQPIEAYADASESLDVPRSIEAHDDSYVLRVRGKSMIDALIDDGDYVIVQPQATARDGDIVVALLEDNGVTLKRFFREQDRIRLQPANSEMEPIYATEVQIQGKVVGVIRKLA
jgi:repressor LexA